MLLTKHRKGKVMMKLIKWLIKLYVKRHPEYLATGGIYIDEQTDVDIIVNRYYGDHYQRGTYVEYYNASKGAEYEVEKMKLVASVRNFPSYAVKYRYIVARAVNGEVWFYGAYDDEEWANTVAAEAEGFVLINEGVEAPEGADK